MVSFYREIAALLDECGIPDADFDARCIIEQVTGKKLEQVMALSELERLRVYEMGAHRIAGEPLQYILGEWEFFGMRIFVGEGVLIPRPDTEVLVETVLDWCQDKPKADIIDLCTGSGCIALALQKHLPKAKIHALDRSREALAYAEKNIRYHRLPVKLHQGDVLQNAIHGRFDVIVSNPPYLTSDEMEQLQPEIRYEPGMALAAGTDGLQFYRGITALWKDSLKPGGLFAYEIGEQQGEAVSRILGHHGFTDIQIRKDYASHDRVVTGVKL